MAELTCPECVSSRLRRSHTRGLAEQLKKFLGYRAYRCRESACRWRGLVKTHAIGDIQSESRPDQKRIDKRLINLLIFLVVIGIGIKLFLTLTHHEPPPGP